MRGNKALRAAAMATTIGLLLATGCASGTHGTKGSSTNSALYDAAQANDEAKVKQLLAGGAHVDDRGRYGRTPLAIATYEGHLQVAKALLDAGADPAAPDDKGLTPLMWAASKGHNDLLKDMLAKHPPVDAQDRRGFTAAHIAADIGNTEGYHLLESVGANLTLRDKKGRTAAEIIQIKANRARTTQPAA